MYPDVCNCKEKKNAYDDWWICRKHGWMIKRPEPVQLKFEFEL